MLNGKEITGLPPERISKLGVNRSFQITRITTTTDLAAAVAGADFVTEAVLEDAEPKKRILREIEKAAPGRVIVASNTSTMPLKQIGETVGKKERLIITHWFNPPHLVPVVEVTRGGSRPRTRRSALRSPSSRR